MQLARQGDGETMRSRGGDWQKCGGEQVKRNEKEL